MQHKISKALFSTTSAKAVKAEKFGYINAIHYMSPHKIAGVGNLCAAASPGCIDLCLGYHSGQASMVKNADDKASKNNVRLSRDIKAKQFMKRRADYMAAMALQIAKQVKTAADSDKRLCVRLNGSTDIMFEGCKVTLDAAQAAKISALVGREIAPAIYPSIYILFKFVQFAEYTKHFKRMCNYLMGTLPSNVSLTFSRSEENEDQCTEILERGGNVAVVFRTDLPDTYLGTTVYDGDKTDLRHTDPANVVVGLLAKGTKAKKDTSGFIVDTL
jgi:hypothetical protein